MKRVTIVRLRAFLKMGGAGDPPAPVGDSPTETAERNLTKRLFLLARTVSPVPSGGSPVLPGDDFPITLLLCE